MPPKHLDIALSADEAVGEGLDDGGAFERRGVLGEENGLLRLGRSTQPSPWNTRISMDELYGVWNSECSHWRKNRADEVRKQ